jgi:hypothetical protein
MHFEEGGAYPAIRFPTILDNAMASFFEMLRMDVQLGGKW